MMADNVRHTFFEDVYAFVIGCSMISLGLLCLHTANLVTGGVAGISLLFSYLIPVSPGSLFTYINIPFLLFSVWAMGKVFTFKTSIASVTITIMTKFLPDLIVIKTLNPAFAAIFGGTIIGMGILSLARHRAGVGGTGVITLWLQKKYKINAGKTQMIIDTTIMFVSLLVLPGKLVIFSALSAAALSGVMIVFYRPDRYLG
ncbi:YitT family protein [Gluconobacter cerinus]|nr:YitT family protein [Gluconobacter cerinus]